MKDGHFWAAHGWGGAKAPLPSPKICHTYPTIMKFGTITPYLKKMQKTYESRDTHPEFCWHHHFLPEISKFCSIKKYSYKLHIGTYFLMLLTVLEYLKIISINLVIILMVSAKMATPGLLKITVFWNKCYDVIISVDYVTNKILSRDSNYIVDVFMWPKFGNYSNSMREVITTSIL